MVAGPDGVTALLSPPTVLWLLLLAWAVHDLEEILMLNSADARRPVPARITQQVPRFSSAIQRTMGDRLRFTLAVALVGLVVLGVTGIATLTSAPYGRSLYAVVLGGFFLHGFGHLGQAIRRRGYVLGVVTSVLIVIPGSLVIYSRLFATGWISPGDAAITAIIGILVVLPVVGAAHLIAAWVPLPWGTFNSPRAHWRWVQPLRERYSVQTVREDPIRTEPGRGVTLPPWRPPWGYHGPPSPRMSEALVPGDASPKEVTM